MQLGTTFSTASLQRSQSRWSAMSAPATSPSFQLIGSPHQWHAWGPGPIFS